MRSPRLSLALGLCLPQLALAATPTPAPRATGGGLVLPAQPGVSLDGPSGLMLNPANLRFLDGNELLYLHQRSNLGDFTADGVYDAFNLDALTIGGSIEWVRPGPGSGPAYRRTSLGLGLGSDTLAVGASYHWLSAPDSPVLDRLGGLDLGASARLWRGFGVAASVQNVDDQKFLGLSLGRRLDVSAAVRPLGERLQGSVDFIVDDKRGFEGAALLYALQGRIVDGLDLRAAVTHYFNQETFAATLGISLDVGLIGAGYAASLDNKATYADHSMWLRVSTARHRAVQLGKKFAVLDLGELLSSSSGLSLGSVFGQSGHDHYLATLRVLERARKDSTIHGVVLKMGSVTDRLGSAHAAELRQAIGRLRSSGKVVWAVMSYADDASYLVASACDRIYVLPEATLLLNGLSMSTMFLGDALQEVGVRVDVARVGAFKNAPDQLTRGDMSDEQRTALNAYLDAAFDQYVRALTADRKLSVEQLQAALKVGVQSPEQAQAMGLVDGVMFPEQIEDEFEKVLGYSVGLVKDYASQAKAPERWGSPSKIAVIRVVGDIVEGKSQQGSLGGGENAGAETVVAALNEARTDSDVQAVVLRVDSPGGSGSAATLIEHAVERVRAKKPVIVSMGNYAASGGYLVAMGGDMIFAEPTTLTGSIGVFVVKPDLSGLMKNFKVGNETLKRGDRADVFGLEHGWDDEEQKVMQKYVDDFYDRFITLVAKARKLDKAEVHKVAQGRVWSGKDALGLKLVDQLGSLQDAIAEAKKRVGLDEADWVALEVSGVPGRGLPSSPLGQVGAKAGELLGVSQDPVGDALKPLGLDVPVGRASRALKLARTPGVQAVLPFELEVK